jgi:hypothetical protein
MYMLQLVHGYRWDLYFEMRQVINDIGYQYTRVKVINVNLRCGEDLDYT